MRTTRSRQAMVAAGLILALAAAGCSNSNDDEAVGDSASAPTGSLCSAIPGEGPGSLGSMSEVPAAEAIAQSKVLTTLDTTLGESSSVETLAGEGPYTIFAPSNAAFGRIPAGDFDEILADQAKVDELIEGQVVEGDATLDELSEEGSAESLSGETVTVEDGEDGVTVNGAKIVCGPIPVENGVVYIVDGVFTAS